MARQLVSGEWVWARYYTNNKAIWKLGTITKKLGNLHNIVTQHNNNEPNIGDLAEIINTTTDTNTQQPSISGQPSTSTRSTQPYIADQPSTSTRSTQPSTSNQQSMASAQPSTANQPIIAISRKNASAASNQLLPQQATRVSPWTRKTPKRLADYIIEFD